MSSYYYVSSYYYTRVLTLFLCVLIPLHVSSYNASLGLQGGSAGPAFLKLLETLEQQGIIERQFAPDLPKNLGGVSGWTVKDGMMEEWQRRRQVRPHSNMCLHTTTYVVIL
jgi:hypothetical protein